MQALYLLAYPSIGCAKKKRRPASRAKNKCDETREGSITDG